MKTIFCLIILCFVISPLYAQTSPPIDSLMAHLGIFLGDDEKMVNLIDTNKLSRVEFNNEVPYHDFYRILTITKH